MTTPPAQATDVVDHARDAWIRRLIDLSRRNNLLYFRDLKTGTLDLSRAAPDAIKELFDGKQVPLRSLVGDDDGVAGTRLREIGRRAQSNKDERGLDTLYLAVGMGTWPADDGGRDAEAALVLQPIEIVAKTRNKDHAALVFSGDMQPNLAFCHVLQQQFQLNIDEESVLDPLSGPGEFSVERTCALFSRLAAGVRGFATKPVLMLGNFSFQKLAMVRDLRDLSQQFKSHTLIRAIAGDSGARREVGAGRTSFATEQLDDVPADKEYAVLDADPSQQAAIVDVRSGDNLVIQGPPGTGKSQTIANLIASLTADGRRVLFVAEKRAALEVVQDRLAKRGLGHLCLDLHGASVTRRQVMTRLQESLERIREAVPAAADKVHAPFEVRRRQLNDHAHRLHRQQSSFGLSVYELLGRLSNVPEGFSAELRFRGDDLDKISSRREAMSQLIGQASQYGPLLLGRSSSSWNGADLPTSERAQAAIDVVSQLRGIGLPSLLAKREAVTAAMQLRTPRTLQDVAELVSLFEQIRSICDKYDHRVFECDLATVAQALAPAKNGLVARFWHGLTDAKYRSALKQIRPLRKEPGPTLGVISEVESAVSCLLVWRKWSVQVQAPFLLDDTRGFIEESDLVGEGVRSLGQVLKRSDLRTVPFEALQELLATLDSDRLTPLRTPGAIATRKELTTAGLAGFLAEATRREIKPEDWVTLFDVAWLRSCLERALSEEPELLSFSRMTHDEAVREFQELDRQRLEAAATRVLRAHGERAISVMNAHPEQEDLIRREAAKKAKHLPLRKLFEKAPDVLTAVAPCWLASPLSVSQLIPGDRSHFDICIFDEASQVLPEDAVTSVLRARQVVVAGDRHQLPPTTFFADQAEEEEEEGKEATSTAGFESILDVMSTFVPDRMLEWHYRSRDESLIQFSNRFIYKRLVTLPGTVEGGAIRHVVVVPKEWRDTDETSVSAEVSRVVELILEHAREHPTKSLGVITMGIVHAERIQAALDLTLQLHPELDAFFDSTNKERFFIKNLERVQGDERDHIILSIGYGKDHSGKLPYRFGPLLYEGGERRLNVAITRARDHMVVVSSFTHLDMDPARSTRRGVEMLRQYLEYASHGGRHFGQGAPTDVPLNPFEASVFDALSAAGIPLMPQWGSSKYRIDMVAKHPSEPGRFVLAIECDGATYHSSHNARARDRLRQQHLEALNWRFHRIWSMDWFTNKEREVQRARAAYDRAVGERGAPTQSQEPLSMIAVLPAIRPPRPAVPKRGAIDNYSWSELNSLVDWIHSDGRLRSDDEIVDELVETLEFARRGKRIEERLREAIRWWRHGRN